MEYRIRKNIFDIRKKDVITHTNNKLAILMLFIKVHHFREASIEWLLEAQLDSEAS